MALKASLIVLQGLVAVHVSPPPVAETNAIFSARDGVGKNAAKAMATTLSFGITRFIDVMESSLSVSC
jgi:hypothetical protein